MIGPFARSLAITIAALLWAPAASFVPTTSLRVPPSSLTTSSCVSRGFHHSPNPSVLNAKECDHSVDQVTSENSHYMRNQQKKAKNNRHYIIGAAALLIGAVSLPSSCTASGLLSHIPTPNDLKDGLVAILDGFASSGTKGMVVYTLLFTLWTMTVGMTTPMETAAGMAFPIQKAIPLSAIGKMGGAFFQYALAKYLFSDFARKKMEGNEWMDKINGSFRSHPYRVALIWRFSPLPEFMKNIGPSLVPTLRTRYQILAIITHGLPFTVLWSFMGAEAAAVARGGQASVFLKRMVAVISWLGLVVSPSMFGWWIKGLGDSTEESNATP